MLRFNNHLVCSIHSRYPFCVHSSLSQSLCSLMLRSTTLSFAQFTQHSCSMANASFRSSGKICGCQIMIPLPLTFLTHFAIAKSGSPRTKSPPPLPPPSLHSRRLAPRHSASKNRSLRSPVFPLLRSSSRLHFLFDPIQLHPENIYLNLIIGHSGTLEHTSLRDVCFLFSIQPHLRDPCSHNSRLQQLKHNNLKKLAGKTVQFFC